MTIGSGIALAAVWACVAVALLARQISGHGLAVMLVVAIIATAILGGCSPRAFSEVNKQAPSPPYAGQYHGGMDRAEYLRDEDPVGGP